ncbi:hypothetical protein DL95DRAFT_406420 [Leptodontidium sp. 2 PMI_412]|nr:hypothetical protein DL95DRAFT_406420 [Leptodontidium sp. 2 PMI_412]
MKLQSTQINKPRAPLRLQSDSHQAIPVPRRQSSRLEAKLCSIPIPHSLEANYKPKTRFQQLRTSPKISPPVGDISHSTLPTSGPIEVSATVPPRTQFQEYSCPSRTQDFGTKLQLNNIVYTAYEARAADDAAKIRELLDQPRASEPPDQLAYNRTAAEREVSGYFQRPNHPWSAVDNQLTAVLSDAQPDIVESYQGARAVHKYLNKSDDDFYGKTQALTVAFNGETLKFYGHHALQISPSSQPASGVDSSAEITAGLVDTRQYPQYLLAGDNPRDSFEDFQRAYKHTRNAEDIGFKWATERKDALESWTNSTAINQDFSIPIAPTDNRYASPAPTCNPITPPQSSKDVSVPLEAKQQSVPTVTEAREHVDFNARGHRKTRARTRHTVAVEGPREAVDNNKSRKTRKR